jgi:hypothetical protein
VRLTQVLGAGEMRAGTFRVDEAAGTIAIWPSTGVDPNVDSVEVGIRPELLRVQGKTNVVVRGLVFRHAASCYAGTAALTICSVTNGKFEDLRAEENNGAGIGTCYLDGVTLRRIQSITNGCAGTGAFKPKNVLWDDVELRQNNWRTAQGAFYGWDISAVKFGGGRDMGFCDFKAYLHLGRGPWFDYDNQNIEIERMISSENFRGGFWSEANPGPITVRSSQFCRNNFQGEVGRGGFEISNSHDVTLADSLMFENAGSQLSIGGGDANGRPVIDGASGETRTLFWRNLRFEGNTYVARGEHLSARITPGNDWDNFVSTLTSDRNNYFSSDLAKPILANTWNGYHDVPGWRALSGKDASSAATAPSADAGKACLAPAVAPDFALVVLDASWKKVAAGSSAAYKLKLFPFGGFSSSASVSIHGLGAIAATGGLSAASLSPSGELVATVETTGATPKGAELPVTVVAESGGRTRTVTFLVTVQ